MKKPHPEVILNTTLPSNFRRIRLELARETDHPTGEPDIAYVIVAPLNAESKIDVELWKRYREAFRVARLRPDKADELGHLVHRPGGTWAFRYDAGNTPDEAGYHLADEHFVLGEYISINEEGALHAFRVTEVTRL